MKQKLISSALVIVMIHVFWVICAMTAGTAFGQQEVKMARGQTVYVPAYSQVNYGRTLYNLTVTLSIRNIDQSTSIIVTDVAYYDSAGKLLKRFLEKPAHLGANTSAQFLVRETDDKDSSGSSFVITWRADKPVNAPIMESIMIGTRNQQGISFTSRGQVIGESTR